MARSCFKTASEKGTVPVSFETRSHDPNLKNQTIIMICQLDHAKGLGDAGRDDCKVVLLYWRGIPNRVSGLGFRRRS